jgi:beta-lactam-binding protein with PASTA domain
LLLAAPVAAAGAPAKVRVPNIIGKTPVQASHLASAAGLKLKSLAQGPQRAAGQLYHLVQRQSPAAGQVVARGSTLNAYVQALNKVPKVMGLPVNRAQQVLTQAGFRYRLLRNGGTRGTPIVNGQQPRPGLRLALGSVVDVLAPVVIKTPRPLSSVSGGSEPDTVTPPPDNKQEGYIARPLSLPTPATR